MKQRLVYHVHVLCYPRPLLYLVNTHIANVSKCMLSLFGKGGTARIFQSSIATHPKLHE